MAYQFLTFYILFVGFNVWYFTFVDCMKPKIKPVVIVPGVGGIQIQAQLDRNVTLHYWCYKKSTWFTLWLSIEQLLPMEKQCFVDNMKLVYNPETDQMENTPGVYTRNPDFGNTSAIEWLDPSVHGPGIYFYPLVAALVNMGYVRGSSLRAAPYDFRFHPGQNVLYFSKLQKLIENTFMENENRKIFLMSHSMGAPYTLYFLNQVVDRAWKDKYIDGWITISGAYAGSVNAVLGYISGDSFGIPSIVDKPITLRQFERTFSSMPYLLPDDRFWKPDEVFVKTENRTYGVNDYDDLFDDIGYPLAKKIRQKTPRSWDEKHPGINTFCFYGSNVKTATMLTYRPGYFPDYYPDIEYGNGDGTVPLRSLKACEEWKTDDTVSFASKVFPGAEHNNILGDARLIRSIMQVLDPN